MKIPTRAEMPGLTRAERQHLAHLIRRRDFLAERIESSDEDLSWDKAELSALTWVIEAMEADQ